uniref:Zinc finger protein 277 n=1 Tax=Maylandia zebra TaxID=106582 RepID=A0A3P9AV38_9CICH
GLGVGDSPSKDSILEPLCFPDQPADISSPPGVQCPGSEPLVCLFCSESVPPPRKDVLLRHLLMEHKLVIADVKLIADVPKYLLYWKGRFLEQPLTDFCSVIKTNSTAQSQEDYFLLCDVLPEDRVLREKLQQKRLEEVLEQQQKERDDSSFHRLCMFCSEEFTGNRLICQSAVHRLQFSIQHHHSPATHSQTGSAGDQHLTADSTGQQQHLQPKNTEYGGSPRMCVEPPSLHSADPRRDLLQGEVNHLPEWYSNNNLSLNVEKTNSDSTSSAN